MRESAKIVEEAQTSLRFFRKKTKFVLRMAMPLLLDRRMFCVLKKIN